MSLQIRAETQPERSFHLLPSYCLRHFEFFFCALLRENANLAVTVWDDQNQILAHASFLDHPAADLVDQALWEPFLHKHFSSDRCTVVIIQ